MNKNLILALIAVVSLLSACGRLSGDNEVQNDSAVDASLVALADGTIMDVACIRTNAKAIMAQGRGAAQSCVMGNAKTQTSSDGRGFGSYYPQWYSSYYYYPPSYYDGTTTSSTNLCGYLGFYGSGYNGTDYGYGYGYNYNYSYGYGNYNYGFGYGTTSTSSSSYPYNCYQNFLGYNPVSTTSYDNNCDYCYNRANPSKCYNRCLYKGAYIW